MKKIALLAVMAGALTFTACRNTPSKDKNADGEVTAGEHLDHSLEKLDDATHTAVHQAEEDYNKAKAELDAAIAKGDKEAEKAARKTLSDAETAWDKAKADLKTAGEKMETGVNNAVDATKDAAKKTGEAIENTAEKAGDKIESGAKAVGDAAKDAANKTEAKANKLKEALKN